MTAAPTASSRVSLPPVLGSTELTREARKAPPMPASRPQNDERRQADAGHVDAGATSGFLVAADGHEVAAVPRAVEHEGEHDHDDQHQRDHVGHALLLRGGVLERTVLVEDAHDDEDQHGGETALQGHHRHRRPVALGLPVLHGAEGDDAEHGDHPRQPGADAGADDPLDDLVLDADAAALFHEDQQDALEDEEVGEGHDEARDAELGDQEAGPEAEQHRDDRRQEDRQRQRPVGLQPAAPAPLP